MGAPSRNRPFVRSSTSSFTSSTMSAIGDVYFRDGHDAPFHAEELADIHVLPGLGHDRFVCGNHEEHHVDAPGPCHHMFHEPLMAGHVDDADEQIIAEAVVGEAELDRDAPLLLFFEPVAVDSGEGLDEGGFSVIDVARRPDYYLFHGQMIL